MPEIQALTDEVQRLSQSVDSWNDWRIFWMVIAAIAAICIVIVQSKAITTARSLSDTQAALLQAKEEKLAKEMREKDVLIAKANERSALATEKAAEVTLAFKKYKTPRRLSSEQQALFIEKLKRLPGTVFDISAKDPEPLDLALDIKNALMAAGWDWRNWAGEGEYLELPNRPPGTPFRVGMIVLSGIEVQILDPNLSDAKDALVGVLKFSGFEGVRGSAPNVPAGYPNRNVMHIMIGTKP